MVDMTTAYGVLANGGERVDIDPILEVKDSRGRVLQQNECALESRKCVQTRVLSSGISFILSHILADNEARTPAFGSRSVLYDPDHTVSVKTGTTNDFKDNWTIGYTPDYVVATWVGNNDGSPMGKVVSGLTGASPIWRKMMDELLKDTPDIPLVIPSDVISKPFCAFPDRGEYFIVGTETKKSCIGKTREQLELEEEARQKEEEEKKRQEEGG